jgi:hypothetical protein
MRERHPDGGFRLARLTVEFLGAIPRSDITVETEIVRDGRRIRLIEASMHAAGKKVALARAWQIAANGDVLAGAELKGAKPVELPPLPPPEQPQRFFTGRERWGYGESVDWRRVRGTYRGTGYAQAWMRPRVPLIAGRKIHPLDRYPAGDWVLLSARSDLADDGLGSTSGTLSDESGPLGTVTQPLLVAPAPRP